MRQVMNATEHSNKISQEIANLGNKSYQHTINLRQVVQELINLVEGKTAKN